MATVPFGFPEEDPEIKLRCDPVHMGVEHQTDLGRYTRFACGKLPKMGLRDQFVWEWDGVSCKDCLKEKHEN